MCDLLQGDPQSCPNTIAKRLLSVQNGYLRLPSVSFKFFFFVLAFFFNFCFYFILLYNTVLVLPYVDMNQPRVYFGCTGSSLQCGLFIAVQALHCSTEVFVA